MLFSLQQGSLVWIIYGKNLPIYPTYCRKLSFTYAKVRACLTKPCNRQSLTVPFRGHMDVAQRVLIVRLRMEGSTGKYLV